MCGRIRDSDLIELVRGCPTLADLELDGLFLCTNQGVSEFGKLTGLYALSLSNAPKITFKAFESLSKKIPLHVLRLVHCSNIGQGIGEILAQFPDLDELMLQFIGELNEEELLLIISNCGKDISTLFLEGFSYLTDKCLEQISISCKSLSKLSIASSFGLSNAGLNFFFNTLKSSLTYVSLQRIPYTEDSTLISLLENQAKTLVHVDLNGSSKLTSDSLSKLSNSIELKYIDLSWIRGVDDDILKAVLTGCTKLNRIKIYGCNRLTDDLLSVSWTNELSEIIQIYGNEFD